MIFPTTQPILRQVGGLLLLPLFTLSIATRSQAQEVLDETTVTSSAPPPAAAPTPAPAPSMAPAIETAPFPEPEPPVKIYEEASAFRTGTPLIDIPQSVTVFSEERIEEQDFTSIGQIVDYTPGLTNSQGEGHRDAVVFRGRRATADFYVDGLRDDVQYFRSLYNVDQVEILRGPSALYFGRGNPGGLINRVMKKPVLAEPGYGKSGPTYYDFFDYGFTVDTFGATLSQIDVNQSLGMDAAFRLNAYFETLENHRDFFEGTRYGVNPRFAMMLGPDTRLDLSYEYENHDRFIDRGIPVGTDRRPLARFNDTVFGDPNRNFNDFDAHVFRGLLTHDFNDNLKARVSTLYGGYDKIYSNYYPATYDPATDIVGIDGYIDLLRRERFAISGDLVGEFNTGFIGHKVLIGTEYNNSNTDASRLLPAWTGNAGGTREFFTATGFRINNGTATNVNGVSSTGNFTTFGDDTSVEVDAFSFFLQDEISLGDYLDLVFGGRYDSVEVDVVGSNRTGDLTGSRTDEEISPRIGAVIKPVEPLSIYGLYSESFLPQSGEQFANLGNEQFDPNLFSIYEFGVKVDIMPGLNATAAWFESEQTSFEQVGDDDNFGREIQSEVTGFEFALNGQVTDRWSTYAGYTYLDGASEDGIRLRELPENHFSIWNTYALTDRLGLGLGGVLLR
ncbi:MAG: TonB-dependent receptor [Verrucomicrobiota bacterium]